MQPANIVSSITEQIHSTGWGKKLEKLRGLSPVRLCLESWLISTLLGLSHPSLVVLIIAKHFSYAGKEEFNLAMVEHEYQRFARTQLAGSGRARWSTGILEVVRSIENCGLPGANRTPRCCLGVEISDASRPSVPRHTVPSKHESLHAALCHVPLAAFPERDCCVFQGRRRQGPRDGAYRMGTNGGWTCVTVGNLSWVVDLEYNHCGVIPHCARYAFICSNFSFMSSRPSMYRTISSSAMMETTGTLNSFSTSCTVEPVPCCPRS